MSKVIQEFNEISDSRQVLDAKPSPIIIIFINIIIIFIGISLVWSYFGETEIVVKANGIVKVEGTQSIFNKKNGVLQQVNIYDGKKVTEGEILYIVNYSDLELQKSEYKKQINDIKEDTESLIKLKNCIRDNKSYFNAEKEKYYYNKFSKYLHEYNFLNSQGEISKDQIEIQIKTAQTQIQDIEKKIYNLNLLKKSINENKNYINNDSSYNNEFLIFENNIKKYKKDIEQAEKYYESLINKNEYFKEELAVAKDNLENLQINLEDYINTFSKEIANNIEENENLKKSTQITIDSNNKLLSSTKDSNVVSSNKFKENELISIDDSINSNENRIKDLDNSLKKIDMNIEDYIIRAPIEGRLSINNSIKEGDIIALGANVATIIPEDNSKYNVQITIFNQDIANIKEGQNIKFHVYALPYREYGDFDGKIIKVSTDSQIDSKSGLSYYLAEASIDKKYVYSRNGEEAELKVGMSCETQIITRKEKILYYILDKFNLK